MQMRSPEKLLEKELEMFEKRKQLLIVNKEKARILLLGAMSESRISEEVRHDWNGKE